MRDAIAGTIKIKNHFSLDRCLCTYNSKSRRLHTLFCKVYLIFLQFLRCVGKRGERGGASVDKEEHRIENLLSHFFSC